MRIDFPTDKEMIQLYWSLMQLAEDTKDIQIPLESLSFLNEVDIHALDPPTYYKFT